MEAKRPFSQLDWLSTPQPVKDYIVYLEKTIFQMQQQLGQLEKRTKSRFLVFYLLCFQHGSKKTIFPA